MISGAQEKPAKYIGDAIMMKVDKTEEAVRQCLAEIAGKDEFGNPEYEIFADYGDKISLATIADIVESPYPMDAIYEAVDDAYMDYQLSILSEFTGMVKKILSDDDGPLIGGLSEADSERIGELVNENLSFALPMDHFLNQEVAVDLMIDTGDGNTDYTANSVYPSYYGEKAIPIEKEASLVWLAETQGYSYRDLVIALHKGDVANPKGFLDSVRQEVANITSSMNCLTFLLKMTLRDLIQLNTLIKLQEPGGQHFYDANLRPDCGMIRISKKAVSGLYDPWNGAGSLFEIELEKDVDLPIRYIRSAMPDGSTFRWSVSAVYGMMDSAWKDAVLKITNPGEGI